MPRKYEPVDRSELTPNHFPNPVTDQEVAAVGVMCPYLGFSYPEGTLIPFDDHHLWECRGGTWQKTDQQC